MRRILGTAPAVLTRHRRTPCPRASEGVARSHQVRPGASTCSQDRRGARPTPTVYGNWMRSQRRWARSHWLTRAAQGPGPDRRMGKMKDWSGSGPERITRSEILARNLQWTDADRETMRQVLDAVSERVDHAYRTQSYWALKPTAGIRLQRAVRRVPANHPGAAGPARVALSAHRRRRCGRTHSAAGLRRRRAA